MFYWSPLSIIIFVKVFAYDVLYDSESFWNEKFKAKSFENEKDKIKIKNISPLKKSCSLSTAHYCCFMSAILYKICGIQAS